MERITEKRKSPLVMSQWCGDSESLRIYNRLSKYEDINLTPEDITANLAKLAEYEAEEKAGRLVRLPCAIGTHVYEVIHDATLRKKHIVEGKFVLSDTSNFGKTVFLDEQSAITALEEHHE